MVVVVYPPEVEEIPVSLAQGGTGAALTDPGADRIMFWDESGNVVGWLAASTGLSISGTNITVTSAPILTTARAIGGVNFDGSAAINPGVPVSSHSAAYPIVLADANTALLHPTADDNPRTFTIPANGTLAFAVGSCLTFVNQINTLSIAITTDTLVWANDGSTGTRTITGYGMATAIKIATTTWLISGSTTLA
jgi:hypothetical protein